MSNSAVDNFINKLNSNANGVLQTITNENVELNLTTTNPFAFDVLSQTIELPLVLLAMNFTGDQNFQMHFAIHKKLVATLSDLMMLGDGSADYVPEEHNDAIQEMYNQILGSLNADLAGDGASITGTVANVELTDMEIQKDFLEGSSMSTISINLLGENYTSFLIFDSMAEESISNLMPSANLDMNAPVGNSETPLSQEEIDMFSGSGPSQPAYEEPPVNVSRASFTNLQANQQQKQYSNINIDLLMDVELPITVELGRKNMKIKEILELGQGSVVELDKLAGDFVDILVNGKKFAVGEVMVVEENFAIRIVNLVSREERIKSLGK